MCQNESNWNKFVFLMATGKGDPKRKPKSPLLTSPMWKRLGKIWQRLFALLFIIVEQGIAGKGKTIKSLNTKTQPNPFALLPFPPTTAIHLGASHSKMWVISFHPLYPMWSGQCFFFWKSFIFRFLENCFWGANLYNAVGWINRLMIIEITFTNLFSL